MNLIRYLLLGEATPEVKAARTRQYHREYMRAREDLKENDKARKRARYASDVQFRERRKADERARRQAMTAEQRAAQYQQRKVREATLPPEEFERRRARRAEACRRWRQKNKETRK